MISHYTKVIPWLFLHIISAVCQVYVPVANTVLKQTEWVSLQ